MEEELHPLTRLVSMVSFCGKIRLSTHGELDVLDITNRVASIVEQAGIADGQVTVFVPGSTAALTTIEYELGAVQDLRNAIERMAPNNIEYAHNLRWGDGNGHSHVRAAMIGPDLHIPVIEGRLTLGTWQQIVLIDCDNRARQRELIVSVIGN